MGVCLNLTASSVIDTNEIVVYSRKQRKDEYSQKFKTGFAQKENVKERL